VNTGADSEWELRKIELTNSLESIRDLAELISMRHPHLEVRWESLKEFAVTSLDTSHV
jgi:hypothetical protein